VARIAVGVAARDDADAVRARRRVARRVADRVVRLTDWIAMISERSVITGCRPSISAVSNGNGVAP
jgi:hypothetical protein